MSVKSRLAKRFEEKSRECDYYRDYYFAIINNKMPCVECPARKTCDFAFDSYNINTVARIDRLAAK